MATPRDWLTLDLRSANPPRAAGPATFRPLAPSDAEPLARLMVESYRGTVDDGGETLDDARAEVAKLLAGVYGSLDWSASLVAGDAQDLHAATIVTRDRVAPPPLSPGEAFLAFSMTAPGWKRRGLARAGALLAINILRARGEPRLHLVVTRANTPAVALYRSLGFADGPIGEPAAG